MHTFLKLSFVMAAAAACLFLVTSCATDDTPKPPREKLSNLPHARPESWEGTAGFGSLPQTR